MAMRQLDYYKRLADSDERVMLVRNQRELNTLLDTWREDTEFGEHKLGLVVLMEGADPSLSLLSWKNGFMRACVSSGRRGPRRATPEAPDGRAR